MKIGIDFGTSYSAAAAVRNGTVEPILFNGQKQFRTAIFFPDVIPDPEDFPLEENKAWIQREFLAMAARQRAQVKEKQAQRSQFRRDAESARKEVIKQLPAGAKRDAKIAAIDTKLAGQLATVSEATLRPDEDLQRDAERLVRRLWLEKEMNRPQRIGANLGNALFGEDAIEAYLSQLRGTLVQSPKSMLGQKMESPVRTRVFRILTHTLLYIRRTASQQLGADVTAATLGRPVKFRSSLGDAGGVQAEQLLAAAARAAGFDEVDFLEEPRAAALKFHEDNRDTAAWAMIVDIGGGTSDIAWGTIGGNSRTPAISGSHGGDFGGSDVDVKLNLDALMPTFGREQARISLAIFSEAARVADIPEQARFFKEDVARFAEPYGTRLTALQRHFGGTTLLNRHAENAKIRLSTHKSYAADLSEILPGTIITVKRENLDSALAMPASWLGSLEKLLRESALAAEKKPKVIYLTGGMSRAGYVQAMVEEVFPDAHVVPGDASFGVVEGLARFAAG